MRDVGKRFTPALILALVAALSWVPAANAASDEITAVNGDVFAGGTGAGGSTDFLLDAGSNPVFVNADSVASHNVVATDDGPDAEPLFETPLISRSGSVTVPGTQYLTPATYRFLCTIHVGMEGSLTVSGPGAKPRPEVALSITSSRIRRVAKGKLGVKLAATTAAAGIELEARLGSKVLGSTRGIDLAAGTSQGVKLKLSGSVRRLLAERDKARVVVRATVPYGAPAAAKRTLK